MCFLQLFQINNYFPYYDVKLKSKLVSVRSISGREILKEREGFKKHWEIRHRKIEKEEKKGPKKGDRVAKRKQKCVA